MKTFDGMKYLQELCENNENVPLFANSAIDISNDTILKKNELEIEKAKTNSKRVFSFWTEILSPNIHSAALDGKKQIYFAKDQLEKYITWKISKKEFYETLALVSCFLKYELSWRANYTSDHVISYDRINMGNYLLIDWSKTG